MKFIALVEIEISDQEYADMGGTIPDLDRQLDKAIEDPRWYATVDRVTESIR